MEVQWERPRMEFIMSSRPADFLLFSSLPLTWPYKIGLSGAAQICLAGLEQLELQMGWRKAGTDSLFDRLAEILKTKSIYKQEIERISKITVSNYYSF